MYSRASPPRPPPFLLAQPMSRGCVFLGDVYGRAHTQTNGVDESHSSWLREVRGWGRGVGGEGGVGAGSHTRATPETLSGGAM